jgi:hypothetical protein
MATSTIQFPRRWTATLIGIGLSVVGAAPTLIATSAADEPPKEWDGLVRVEHKQLDHFYVLPGASLEGYKRIRLDPAQVEFDKNWKPNENERSPGRRLSKDDFEKIKSTMSSEFTKVFKEELAESGYVLWPEDGEDVLRVTPAIVNLYITAPDKKTAGRSRTYITSSGHMTLVAELRDSVTGQLLARAVDNVQGRDTGNLQWSTSASNLGDAREALKKWADVLRKGLDDANVRPAGKTG